MKKTTRFWNSNKAHAIVQPPNPNAVQAKQLAEMAEALPEAVDPQALAVGKKIIAFDDSGKEVEVVVEHVLGNIADPRQAEINGRYLVSFLDFYCQLLENRRPDPEEVRIWNEISIDKVLSHDPSGKGTN